jgi:DNA-binding CsgD family transcriptional regulator
MVYIEYVRKWLGLAKDSGPNVGKLDDYQYEVIKELASIGVEPYELADVLNISESRAKYELNKVKNGATNSK